MNDRLQFGYSRRPGGVVLGARGGGGYQGFSGGNVGDAEFPMSGFPVAYAVWVLNEQIVGAREPQPNIIQRRIVPAIVCWQYNAGLVVPMQVAAYFGGPAIDKFLLRQKWNADPRELEWHEHAWANGNDVNRWLYLLAYLNDDAGREFRRRHVSSIMDLADKFYEDGYVRHNAKIDFIFADPRLAREYWPRYAALSRQKTPRYALETQWRYLVRMGTAATADMFVDAWKDNSLDRYDMYRILDLIDQVPPAIRNEVIDKLVQLVQEHPENKASLVKELRSTDTLVRELKLHTDGDVNHRQAASYMKALQQGRPEDRSRLRTNIPLWLEHAEPDSPLVEMLAAADDPDLRLMAVGALRTLPTPSHRQLLDRLLQDADQGVQAAAREAAAKLKALAGQSPSMYVSDAPPVDDANAPVSATHSAE